MTVKKQFISDRQIPLDFSVRSSQFPLANILLALAAGTLLLYYVVLSNQLAADKYSLTGWRARLNEANTALELQNAISASRYSLDDLAAFAQRQGMVEAKESGALFQDPELALSGNHQ